MCLVFIDSILLFIFFCTWKLNTALCSVTMGINPGFTVPTVIISGLPRWLSSKESAYRQMDQGVMVHIHCGISLSHRKEHVWVSSDEVDEAGDYYTEWSESERQILYINMHIYGIWKMVMTTLHAREQKRHRCKEQTFGFFGRRRGWDDMRE